MESHDYSMFVHWLHRLRPLLFVFIFSVPETFREKGQKRTERLQMTTLVLLRELLS